MATIAKSGTPSLSTLNPPNTCKISGLLAGEAIAAGDACYIKSDGLIWLATGAAANAAARFKGLAGIACPVGEAVTLWHDVDFQYGSGLTPGAPIYLGTAGTLDTATSTGGTVPIGYVVDTTRVHVWQFPGA